MKSFYRRIMTNSLGYGKISIPKFLMDDLGWVPGESLAIERIENSIVMTPVVLTRSKGTTHFKGGCNE